MTVFTRRASTPPRRRLMLLVAALGCAVLWWAWPTWSGADADPPVVVVVSPSTAEGATLFDRSLRERGRRAQVVVADTGWCGAVTAAQQLPALWRVVVADPEPGCDPWSDATQGERWFWIAPSGVDAAIQVPSDVTVVDMSWSLGDGGTLRRACEWWDACEADGQVAVRSEPGVMTPAGLARLARTTAVLG